MSEGLILSHIFIFSNKPQYFHKFILVGIFKPRLPTLVIVDQTNGDYRPSSLFIVARAVPCYVASLVTSTDKITITYHAL